MHKVLAPVCTLIHDQEELGQAQVFLMCLKDQRRLYFLEARAVLPSHRGSVVWLIFSYPQTKLPYSRDERIPVPESHFQSGKQASLKLEGTQASSRSCPELSQRRARRWRGEQAWAPCRDCRHQVTARCQDLCSPAGAWKEKASPWEKSLCWLQIHQLEDLRLQILGKMQSRGAQLTVSSHQSPGLWQGPPEDSTPPLREGCISIYGCSVPETFQVINK